MSKQLWLRPLQVRERRSSLYRTNKYSATSQSRATRTACSDIGLTWVASSSIPLRKSKAPPGASLIGFREWGRLPAGLVEEAGTFDQVCFFLVIDDWLEGSES